MKSDSSLIFRRLKELNTKHRVIMTGTPLNNNIRYAAISLDPLASRNVHVPYFQRVVQLDELP